MSTTRWLTESEQRLWRAFHDMRRHLDAVIDRQLTEAGLSSADYQLLVPLSEARPGELRARDLGRVVGWDRSRLSHQLRRMESRGLVRRGTCNTDARGTMVSLTAAGRHAVEAAAPGHVATVRRHFIDLLSPADRTALAGIFSRVTDSVAAELDRGECCSPDRPE